MRNVKALNRMIVELKAGEFYINYEECKVSRCSGVWRFVGCFILTMRNVKFSFTGAYSSSFTVLY